MSAAESNREALELEREAIQQDVARRVYARRVWVRGVSLVSEDDVLASEGRWYERRTT